MIKRLLLCLSLLIPVTGVFAHEGHVEKGAFDPPHGGSFAKLAGHYAEVWIEDGKIGFCLLEESGVPSTDQHSPKNIVLRLSPKGGKSSTLKAAAVEQGCVSWDYTTKAKRVRVELTARVGQKSVRATLHVVPKSKQGAGKADDANKR